MHFWIDKRGQCSYGGYNGRRSYAKRMVTPVHRFQSVECGRRHPNTHHHQQHQQQQQQQQRHAPSAHPSHPSHYGTDQSDDVYLEMPPGEMARVAEAVVPPPPPMMPAHLKCGMWASFALATMFVAGCKFFLDRRVSVIVRDRPTDGMEVIILCALLSVVLLGVCTIALCRARVAPPIPVVSLAPINNTPAPSPRNSSDDLASGTVLSLQSSRTTGPPSPEPPPPPYHIAVLLPQREIIEAPPPTYEKAIS